MLTEVFALGLAVLGTAHATSNPQCTPAQLGKYAPLLTRQHAHQYCDAFLHGKPFNSQQPDSDQLRDLKKESKSYQTTVCLCVVSHKLPAPTSSTTMLKSTTKRTSTTQATIPALPPLSSATASSTTTSASLTTRSSTTTSSTTTSTSTSSSTTTSSSSTSSTTTSSTTTTTTTTTSPTADLFIAGPTCTPGDITPPSGADTSCIYDEMCDSVYQGSLLPEYPISVDNEYDCYQSCDGINHFGGTPPCQAYNYDPNTGMCDAFGSVTAVTALPGAAAATLMSCRSN